MAAFKIVAAAVAALATLALPELAQADRFRVQVRGGFRIGASVRVHVGGGHARPMPPPPPPPPAPIYDSESCACDYPVAPQRVYEPAPPQPYYEPAPVVIAPARRHAQIGLGLYASSTELDSSGLTTEGTGALLRIRLNPSLELEGEIAQARFQDTARADLRLGGSLYVNLAHRGAFVPFLVVGAGVNVIDQPGMTDPAQQGYLEAGGGLTWRLSNRLSFSGDLRMQSLHLAHDEAGSYHVANQMGVDDTDQATSARLTGMLYF